MKKKHGVWAYICLVIYLICISVLVYEASLDGANSADKSNQVGGTIADFFNDVKGDQTVAITPTNLSIKNKTDKGYVGETYQLITETTPVDATYKSVIYSSSNTNVANINNEGIISFLKPGLVDITATNEKYPSVKDSFSIEVSNVFASSIEASIHDVNPNPENIYTLYLMKEYQIDLFFTPENTTHKNVIYSYDTSYLNISETGLITPKKYTANKVLDINIQHEELTYQIKIIIDYENVIKLTGYDISIPSNKIYVSQKENLNINYEPFDATFKDYTLSSSDESIFKIEKNKTIIGISSGKANLTIKSNYYDNISKSIEIEVLPQPNLEDFTLSNITLYVNDTTTISYKKIPQYAKDYSITYESLDPSIASVSSKGVVKGLKNGATQIKVTMNGITKTCLINVKTIEITGDEDFELEIINENLNHGQKYNLKDIVKVSKWIPSDPVNKNMIYTLENNDVGTISNGTITLTKLGIHRLFITHSLTNVTHSIDLNCKTYDFEIKNLNDETITTSSLIVNQSLMFKLTNINLQQYEITNYDDSIISLTNYGEYYQIKALDAGLTSILFTPYIDEETDNNTLTLTIDVSHQFTKSLSYTIYDIDNSQVIELKDNVLNTYINNHYSIGALITSETTISKIRYFSSNEEVVSIQGDGNLIFNNIGTSTIKVEDEYSLNSTTFTINVFNYISLNNDNPYTIDCDDIEQKENNSFAITNGHSGKLNVNFNEASTYQEVEYISSNTDVATIGKDGTITPIKVGKTTITVICDDGMQTKIEFEIEIEIKRQDYIKDLNKFFYDVRKGLGHFSAFLILGIFSTLTWMVFLNGKQSFIGIFLNFGTGFAIASLTELIQVYVPGRYGCLPDVYLDYRGFCLSSIIITIIFLIIYIVRFIKKLKNKYYNSL